MLPTAISNLKVPIHRTLIIYPNKVESIPRVSSFESSHNFICKLHYDMCSKEEAHWIHKREPFVNTSREHFAKGANKGFEAM